MPGIFSVSQQESQLQILQSLSLVKSMPPSTERGQLFSWILKRALLQTWLKFFLWTREYPSLVPCAFESALVG